MKFEIYNLDTEKMVKKGKARLCTDIFSAHNNSKTSVFSVWACEDDTIRVNVVNQKRDKE